MIYFALNAKWDSPVRGAWTAISRAPYLKALSLWAKGNTWNGGGLFTSPQEYWLNEGRVTKHELVEESSEVRRALASPLVGDYGSECPGIYYNRLQRDGWLMRTDFERVTVFDKGVNEHLVLRKLAYATSDHRVGQGGYFDEHELRFFPSGRSELHPDWEWAEFDGNRLLWVSGGCLFAGHVSGEGLSGVQELRDFNKMQFERIKAPY